MAQSKLLVVIAYLALIFVSSYVNASKEGDTNSNASYYSDEYLHNFKKEIDDKVSKQNITCENYENICRDEEEAMDIKIKENERTSDCRIIMNTYLCQGPQNIDTVKNIVSQLVDAPVDSKALEHLKLEKC